MQFDHVEIFVTDRPRACEWYERVLGFCAVEEFGGWADAGPLMISNGQKQMIALFTGPAQAEHPVRGLRRLAFRVSAEEFARFISESDSWAETPLGSESIQDHTLAMSVYFSDPFGNPLEVTTYEYEGAKSFVDSLSRSDRSAR